MKWNIRRILLILVLVLPTLTLSAEAAAVCEPPMEAEWFSFCIVQNDAVVPIRRDTAELEKAPFTLVLIMNGPLGVLVNFSDEATLYDGFRRNKPLAEILESPDMFMGMAEGLENPDNFVLVDAVTPHYLFYQDGAAHRFNRTQMRGAHIVCERDIANFTTFAQEFRMVPMEEYPGEVLFLSLLYGEYDADYNTIEKQKAALRIRFR